jgi:hypothetical protein
MKRARIGVIAAAILAVATITWAQTPDFSGTWTLDPAASGATGTGGGGGRMGGPMTVKQTADTLSIERQGRGGATVTLTYKLDGSESVNKQTMGEAGEVELKSVAKFDGSKLTITTKRPGQDGNIMETSETWTMADGMLTIERTGGRGASKQVYKKGA